LRQHIIEFIDDLNRYFGRRPLIEDNSVTSEPTTLVDLRVEV